MTIPPPLTFDEQLALALRVEAALNAAEGDTVTLSKRDAADLVERLRTLLQIELCSR